MGEGGLVALIDGVHQLVKAPIVLLVSDRASTTFPTPCVSWSPPVNG